MSIIIFQFSYCFFLDRPPNSHPLSFSFQLCGITITSIYGYIQDRRRSSILLEFYSSLVRHFFTPITQFVFMSNERKKLLRIICFSSSSSILPFSTKVLIRIIYTILTPSHSPYYTNRILYT